MSSPARVSSSLAGPRAWLLVLVALAGGTWWFIAPRSTDSGSAYRTAPVQRGEIRTAISATGTLNATATIEIGTQVSGTLQSVEVDFNDPVRTGQVLARIDPSTLQAKLQMASASLSSSNASLNEARAVARNAELDYARKADLLNRQLVARADADQAQAARDQARARIVSATAQVRQQQATVDSARLDLDKSVIRAPVDGVVLLRAVEPGQTVAASLQTPVLFKIAGDLRKMEIALAIDEADIGQVREGQVVHFTVDAFPDRGFSGRVKQVRLAATNIANVITYPVLVEVDNADKSLLPGMTANAEIEISRRPDVLSLPNAALRFRPADAGNGAAGGPAPGGTASRPTSATGARSDGQGGAAMIEALTKIADSLRLDASQRATFDQSAQMLRDRAQQSRRSGSDAAAGPGSSQSGNPTGAGTAGPRPSSGTPAGDRSRRLAERMKQNFATFRASLHPGQQATWDSSLAALSRGKRAPVYRLLDGKPEQISVRIGATDGTRSEIIGSELVEGDLVIVGSARPAP